MMGNDQSRSSDASRRSSSQQATRPPVRRAINDDPPPPPYTSANAPGATNSLAPPTGPSDLRRSRSQGRDSGEPRFEVPIPNVRRRSSSASRLPTPNVGGFRFDLNPSHQSPSAAPAADRPTAPTSASASASTSAPTSAPAAGRAVRRNNTTENILEMLRKYNTLILVDDSSSMAGRRWKDTRAALADLANTASQYDADGVDIHFLNSEVVGSNIKTAQSVESLFDSIEPDGVTPTGEKLEILLLDYILQIEDAQDRDRAEPSGKGTALKAIKPLNLVVLTDGEPSDDPESVIVTAAKRLDARHFPLAQVGIQFVQIGDDRKATEALKELDENLASAYGIRDMVDTTPYTPDQGQMSAHDLAKMLIGGFNRRVDKRGVS